MRLPVFVISGNACCTLSPVPEVFIAARPGGDVPVDAEHPFRDDAPPELIHHLPLAGFPEPLHVGRVVDEVADPPQAIESGRTGTLIPFLKLSMFSASPPTSVATTQRSALQASVRTSPNGSFLLGMATRSQAFRSRT